MMANDNGLRDRHVLVVEDDYFIAQEVVDALARRGAAVVGPVGNVKEAIGAIETMSTLDAAVLDINLHGEMAFPVADALIDRDIPFVFATGYDRAVIPERYGAVARCPKPIDYKALAKLLRV